MPFAIVIVIIIVNFLMQKIFSELAKFEKYNYASSELASRITKIFIASFINTGIIIFVVNFKFTEGTKYPNIFEGIFNGKYKDFNHDWFKRVGTVVAMTMFINMFSMPITILF